MCLGIELNKVFIQRDIIKNYQLSNAYSGELLKKINIVNRFSHSGSLIKFRYATLS